MSEANKREVVVQDCDECGKRAVKIWRIIKGHRYCSTCYARIFKRRMCPACGNFARLPRNDPKAVCRLCQSHSPCVRCNKTDYEIGKMTAYGPACKVCAPYFNEPRPCGLCGKPSIWLSRVHRLGIEVQVCPQCGRQDHAPCEACGRYRLLTEAPDGHRLCKKCLEQGEVPCPKCGAKMPAGYGKQCQKCYCKALLEKRIQMDCASFSSQEMAHHFAAFGQWLAHKVGENKAASTIHRYLAFFIEIERQWKSIPEYKALLTYFGPLRLRRVLLPMLWMQEQKLVVRDAKAKKEESESRRIAVILGKLPKGSQESIILGDYHKKLLARINSGETTLSSVRLALTPAFALLQIAAKMQCLPPNQKVLDVYLRHKPGQRAAVSGFVGFLRDKYKVDIVLPKADSGKAHRQRKKQLEAEMLELMKEIDSEDDLNRRWLSVALAYFHELPKSVGKKVDSSEIVNHDDGSCTVTWRKQQFWVPKR
ncbi:hypothetical protein [Methylomicrobium lacus]|uniref:hypothetical protein n=1 Tax=Methylomicrobium lacus TaxID=136992 RepID=UPI0035A8578F